MALNNIMKIFMPKDRIFYSLFEEVADGVTMMGRLLKTVVSEPDIDKRAALVSQVEEQEHVNDDLTHKIFTELGRNFITPFDREDIHTLASSLDDVVDFINAACARILMYRITDPPPEAGTLARLILAQTEELGKALSNLQKSELVLARCVEINRLENEADQVSRVAIARLFEQETDPITLIKIKELLEFLETATDKAEDVADVLETVVLKNA
jgi:predicted phosphate transport protein (TIGR00153 family)